MGQERRKESSSENKGGEYCRDNMGPSISVWHFSLYEVASWLSLAYWE